MGDMRRAFGRAIFCKQLWRDAGGFVVDVPGYEQPLELIMVKDLGGKA